MPFRRIIVFLPLALTISWLATACGDSPTATAVSSISPTPTKTVTPVLPHERSQIVLYPSKDNTLHEDILGARSNGAGQHFFVGSNGTGQIRRGIIGFDIAGNVPQGTIISGVTLTLNMSRSGAVEQEITLHRLLADWGEGASMGSGNEGAGAPSAPGDATWVHQRFDTDVWEQPGGDFSPDASADVIVGPIGNYTWSSNPQMLADVQDWLDHPETNYGWLLQGNETEPRTTKRFDSRNNELPENRPTLTVEFAAPAIP